MTTPTPPLTVLYFVTEDWYFISHRLPLAMAAKEAGHEVHVLTRVNSGQQRIAETGITIHDIPIDRTRLNPVLDVATLIRVIGIVRRIRPDIIHNVALKPVVYGSIAAKLNSVPFTFNALAGLGYVFSSSELKAKALKPVVSLALKHLLRRPSSKAIVQNDDDAQILMRIGVPNTSISIVRGSGIDTTQYAPGKEPTGPPVVAMSARLTEDKGVLYFVEAARILHSKHLVARFALIGKPDPMNPSSVSVDQLQNWNDEGVVEWWGHSDDMPTTLRQTSIACLPSTYGEGLPKSLLEAGATGLPIVTTDNPGCRDTVVDGVTGYLVPPRDPESLAKRVAELVWDKRRRHEFGIAGRQHVTRHFDVSEVIDATLRLYAEARPHPRVRR